MAVKVGATLSTVRTAHPGAPQVASPGSAIARKWDSTDPFGLNLPSVGAITYNPALPAAYYEAETGLPTNGFRVHGPPRGPLAAAGRNGVDGGICESFGPTLRVSGLFSSWVG